MKGRGEERGEKENDHTTVERMKETVEQRCPINGTCMISTV